MGAGQPLSTLDVVDDLVTRARAWIEADPDPVTRKELAALIETGDTEGLSSRMAGALEFGTAGIRGEVGAGPNRMNRAVVIRTTAGLATHLLHTQGRGAGPVVVGFDARPASRQFAEDVAGVLAASGLRVVYFPEVAPTPLVAFMARSLKAIAAVVITASHNPPADNGYKVYGANAAQIIPPADGEIARLIEAGGAANDVPRIDRAFSTEHDNIALVPDKVVDLYWREVETSRPSPTGSDLKIVYTPIHGVGGAVFEELFARAGHRGVIPVTSQFTPDGTFPTVRFPNPEEPGALDLALATAREVEADLVIANDPDADRLAAALPFGGDWTLLTGNEMGALLGDYLLRHWQRSEVPIVVRSVVSSPLIDLISRHRGARVEVTLTGFKWIVNAGLALEAAGEGVFAFGYEEALGYCVGQTVRDKDGLSAALVFADLVAGLSMGGETVWDRLTEIWVEHGVWASAQGSMAANGPRELMDAIDRICTEAPRNIAGMEVSDVTDYRLGAERRPTWLGEQALVELSFGDSGRALLRPSGTEPKLKIYTDLTSEASSDPFRDKSNLLGKASGVIAGLKALIVS